MCVVDKAREQELASAIEAAAAGIRDAYKVTDPGVDVKVASADRPADAWGEEATRACSTSSRSSRPGRSR